MSASDSDDVEPQLTVEMLKKAVKTQMAWFESHPGAYEKMCRDMWHCLIEAAIEYRAKVKAEGSE